MIKPQQNTCRTFATLDGLWQLRFERPNDNTDSWSDGFLSEKPVAVPASFNDLYTTYAERNHWGAVWYQTSFEAPELWRNRRIALHFGAVAYSAEVWMNGTRLGFHETGYTPFEFDISRVISFDGPNRLVLRVQTRLTPETIPQGEIKTSAVGGQLTANHPPANFDFFPYAGIHRSVSLCVTSFDHLSAALIDSNATPDGADVNIRVHAEGGADTVRLRILETGDTAEAPLDAGRAGLRTAMCDPDLWSPESPNLYHARIELFCGGKLVDVSTQRFGIRSIEIRGKQLLLNGKPICLKGFGRHEDFPIIGKGLCPAVMVRDFELMRWTGANSFRTTHYPYAEEQLDLADELGFLVISESPAVSLVPDQATEQTRRVHAQAIREFMERDYNHPSVITWCLANEPLSAQPAARPYFEEMIAAAREVDAGRPLMLVSCHGLKDTCMDLFDFVGINAYPGWYGGGAPLEKTMTWFKQHIAELRNRYPDKPMMLTEFGGDAVAGFHALPSELWTEDYQRDLIAEVLDTVCESGEFIGTHVWNLTDFRTGQNDRRALGNRKGIFTRDRQPKMAAYLLRELWCR